MTDHERMDDNVLDGVTGGSGAMGFNCPVCGEFIQTSMEALVSSNTLTCLHCGLVLTIDKSNSAKAIELMNAVESAKQRVNEIKV